MPKKPKEKPHRSPLKRLRRLSPHCNKPSSSSSSSSYLRASLHSATMYPGILWHHLSSLISWTWQSLGFTASMVGAEGNETELEKELEQHLEQQQMERQQELQQLEQQIQDPLAQLSQLSHEQQQELLQQQLLQQQPSSQQLLQQQQLQQQQLQQQLQLQLQQQQQPRLKQRRWRTSLKSTAARLLRRRYILSYTKNSVRAVFSRRWMKQAVRWDFVGVSLSKMWGTLNNKPLPVWARKPVYQMWGKVFRCNMNEVRDPLHTYPTLESFFSRHLKDGARPIAPVGMVSPVDGKVMACGEVKGDQIEHVKGKSYSLSSFLGSRVDGRENTKLYHCVIYLHPGDYHRIHFPVECTFNKRRHFPGTLFPVNPPFLKLIPSLFALNERVALLGEWEQGFFSLTAVGAYNVGSITLNFDEGLHTNHLRRDYTCPNLEYFSWKGVGSYSYESDYRAQGHPVTAGRGDELGQFHFGSTVVLIFEAENFQFAIQPGQYLKMGQYIGSSQ